MFVCYLHNFAYFLDDAHESLEEAIEYGRSKGFEFTVFQGKEVIGSCIGPSLAWHCSNSDFFDKNRTKGVYIARVSL